MRESILSQTFGYREKTGNWHCSPPRIGHNPGAQSAQRMAGSRGMMCGWGCKAHQHPWTPYYVTCHKSSGLCNSRDWRLLPIDPKGPSAWAQTKDPSSSRDVAMPHLTPKDREAMLQPEGQVFVSIQLHSCLWKEKPLHLPLKGFFLALVSSEAVLPMQMEK